MACGISCAHRRPGARRTGQSRRETPAHWDQRTPSHWCRLKHWGRRHHRPLQPSPRCACGRRFGLVSSVLPGRQNSVRRGRKRKSGSRAGTRRHRGLCLGAGHRQRRATTPCRFACPLSATTPCRSACPTPALCPSNVALLVGCCRVDRIACAGVENRGKNRKSTKRCGLDRLNLIYAKRLAPKTDYFDTSLESILCRPQRGTRLGSRCRTPPSRRSSACGPCKRSWQARSSACARRAR